MSALTKISPEQVYNSLLLTEANKTAVVSGKEVNSSQVKIFKSSVLNQHKAAMILNINMVFVGLK